MILKYYFYFKMETERQIIIEETADNKLVTINENKQLIIDKFETDDKNNPSFDIITKDNQMFMKRKITEKDLSLFSDQRWESAKQNMTEEDLKHYEEIGKQFHESINYTTGENTGVPIPQPISESIAYIEMGLRSGLSPEDLDESEISVMKEYLGDNWADKYA